MSTGTKAFLTLFAAAIAVLVLYYGVLMPASPQVDPLAATGVVDPAVTAPPVDELPATQHQPEQLIDQSQVSISNTIDSAVEPIVPAAGDSVGDGLNDILPLALSDTDPALAMNDGDATQPAEEPLPTARSEQPLAPPPAVALTPASDTQPPAKIVIKPSAPNEPPASTRTPPPSTKDQTTEYIVQSGDTFISIADAHFGDGRKWDLIAKANPLVDPNRLKIGQKLRLPPKDAKRPAPAVNPAVASGTATTYTVQSEDTLSSIAEALLGDKSRWREIYEANRAVLKNNPDKLVIGMPLVIPK